MVIIERSTIQDQLDLLRNQGLQINDPRLAFDSLSVYGYSNLIKEYRTPFIYMSGDEVRYRDGVGFEQILSLFLLDKNLRNAVMAAMLDFEEFVKEAAADVVSISFGTTPDEYLLFRNYQNKRKRIERFSLRSVLDTMRTAIQSGKPPIAKYTSCGIAVPPWILFKGVYMSTIVNFIDQFKKTERDAFIERVYGAIPITDNMWELATDTLFVCLDFRNTSAHGGRIYDHPSRNCAALPGFTGFSQLVSLLKLLRYKNPYNRLMGEFEKEVTRHCSSFPQDLTYLGQIFRADIKIHRMVWVSENSVIYHNDARCSGLKRSKKIRADDAAAAGMRPCRKCARLSDYSNGGS